MRYDRLKPAMLEGVKVNIERLIALYESAKESNVRLQEALAKSEAENKACRERIGELEDEIGNLHLAEAFRSPAGSGAEAKEKIDRLVKEIDKCIALLEK